MGPDELMKTKAELEQELDNATSEAEYNARLEGEDREEANTLAGELTGEIAESVAAGAEPETLTTEASLSTAQAHASYHHDLRVSNEERAEELKGELEELNAEAERMRETLKEE